MTDRPDWDPLIDLVGLELVVWFMWMYAVELADGTCVHAYKHCATRRYLHVADDGRVFADDREIALADALREACAGWETLAPEPPAAALVALEKLTRQ